MGRIKPNKLVNQLGFGMVEMLVGLSILFIISLAFIPLTTFVAEATQSNKSRLVATELATSEIERVRMLPYHSIGNVGGNPEGPMEREKTVILNGVTYTVTTDIWWLDDTSDDTGGSDSIPYDYKRVKIAVSAPGYFSGSVTTTMDINTLSSLDGEEEAFPGGNIRAKVDRGWTNTGEKAPVANAGVTHAGGPTSSQTVWTDEFGRAMFAIIDAGTYTANVTPPEGMMVNPQQVDKTVEVANGVTSEVGFEVEYPCYLTLELRDSATNQVINVPGNLVLTTPFGYSINKSFTNGTVDAAVLGQIWPVGSGYAGNYGLQVLAQGYMPYFLPESGVWDGTFGSPGQTVNLTLYLQGAAANIVVTSQGSGAPVANATVEVFDNNATFPSTPLVVKQTGANGYATFTVAELFPGHIENGTRSYSVKVSKGGFYNFEQLNAFSVSYIAGEPQVPVNYPVILQQVTGSIKVTVYNNRGTPRSGVTIRVTGPYSYSAQKLTGADGVALFIDLLPGTYTVERKRQGGWDSTVIVVTQGEVQVSFGNNN